MHSTLEKEATEPPFKLTQSLGPPPVQRTALSGLSDMVAQVEGSQRKIHDCVEAVIGGHAEVLRRMQDTDHVSEATVQTRADIQIPP